MARGIHSVWCRPDLARSTRLGQRGRRLDTISLSITKILPSGATSLGQPLTPAVGP